MTAETGVEEEKSHHEHHRKEDEEDKKDTKRKGSGDEKEASGREFEVFVGSLPFSAREDDVEKFFEKFGDVVSVKLLQKISHILLLGVGRTAFWERICEV